MALPLTFNYGTDLAAALAGIGGGSSNRLTDILNSVRTKPYMSNIIGQYAPGTSVPFGVNQLQGLLPFIENPNRIDFFNNILNYQTTDNTGGGNNPPPAGQYSGINILPGLANALGIVGDWPWGGSKSADRTFRDIMQQFYGRPILDPYVTDNVLRLGMPELVQILGSGLVENQDRQRFFNTLIGLGAPGQFNADIGLLQDISRIPEPYRSALLELMGDDTTGGGEDTSGNNGNGDSGNPFDGIDWGAIEGLINIEDLPNFQLIQDTIAAWLSGENPLVPNEIDFLPEGFDTELQAAILEMMSSTGLPEEILTRSKNDLTARIKARERERIMGARDRAAGRGISDSGIMERSIRDIRDAETDALIQGLTGIDMESARHATTQRAQGLSAANQFAQTMLGAETLGYDSALAERAQDLKALSTSIAGMLGLGNLEIQSISAAIDAQLEEARLNLLMNDLFGIDSEGDATDAENQLNEIMEKWLRELEKLFPQIP